MKGLLVASAALGALTVPFALGAQTPAFSVDSLTAAAGDWSYRSYAGGSEAAFADATGNRLLIRCNRVARTVSIARTGVPAATGTMAVWTSSLSRSVPTRFEATRVLTADLAATDPLLDAISLSRGKFATLRAWSAGACGAELGAGQPRDRGLQKLRWGRAGVTPTARSHRELPKDFCISSLAINAISIHPSASFNTAKGGDPMSHGSAQRSEMSFGRWAPSA